jgi:hypothetical protein
MENPENHLLPVGVTWKLLRMQSENPATVLCHVVTTQKIKTVSEQREQLNYLNYPI